MNRDIQIPAESDYLLKLELLGENNTAYSFGDNDTLTLIFNDVKGINETELEIDLNEFENPLSVLIPLSTLEEYSTDPIKYKLVLYKDEDDLTTTLLSGNIFRS